MKKVLCLALLIFPFLLLGEKVEVSTPIGKFLGVVEEDVKSFKGIQYATANRWESPVMVKSYSNDTYDATGFRARCYQPPSLLSPTDRIFSEQCLYLNIWAPAIETEKKLPVMVFIHGGAFYLGSGQDVYVEGKNLAKKDVILVTINYRLGFYGFLSHPQIEKLDPQNPSNFGLLDQVTALRWVQHYISHFGGDAHQVTVFGESAGAISIMYLLASKAFQESPLFQKAIIQSPVASMVPSHYPYGFQTAKKVAVFYHCESQDPKQEYECLLNITGDQMLAGFKQEFRRGLFFHTQSYPLYTAPMLDPNFPVSPYDIFINRSALAGDNPVKHVDIMIGACKDEGNLFAFLAFPIMSISNEFMDKALEHVFDDVDIEGHSETHNVLEAFSKQLTKYYPPYDYPDAHARFSDVFGDFYFECPIQAITQAFAKSDEKIYRYLFSQHLENGRKFLGTYHGSELPFVFNKTGNNLHGFFTEGEKKTMEIIVDLWTSFAKTGKPVATIEGKKVELQPFDAKSNELIMLQDPVTFQSHYKQEKCQMWQDRFPHGIHRSEENSEWQHEHHVSFVVNLYGVKVFQFLRANSIAAAVGGVVLLIFMLLSLRACCCAQGSKKVKTQ